MSFSRPGTIVDGVTTASGEKFINPIYDYLESLEDYTAVEKAKLTPRPVIWDTDWWTDCDDAVAARVLLWAERAGMIDVVCVAVSAYGASSIPSIDAFFTAEGRPNMTFGIDHDATDYSGIAPFQANMRRHPHYIPDSSFAESAVTMYRRALAAATEKVDIICAGYMNALSGLLQSAADSISPLTGLQLVTQKVNKLWAMAGNWSNNGSGSENNFYRNARSIAAGNYVCANWPTEITFLGYEVGESVLTGETLAALSPADDDLLTQALADHGSSAGRSSWDPMLTLMACIGDVEKAGYFAVKGTAAVNASTGTNTFTYSGSGKHEYVIKEHTDVWYKYAINKIIESLDRSSRKTIGQKQLEANNSLDVVTDGLVIWLDGCKLDNTRATKYIKDKNGSDNAARLVNFSYSALSGNNGFDNIAFGSGISDYIEILNTFTFGSNSFTVELFLKRGAAAGAVEHISGQKTGAGAANTAFCLYFDASNYVNFQLSNGTAYSTITGTTAITDTTAYHHIVALRDGNTMKLYVDNTLQGAAAFSSSVVSLSSGIFIGTLFVAGTQYLYGTVSGYRIYNKALSASEISQNYSIKR